MQLPCIHPRLAAIAANLPYPPIPCLLAPSTQANLGLTSSAVDRIRKVKCDEEKPFCMRCTKTGRRCDGYLDAKAISQRRRRSGGLGQNGAGEPHAPLASLFEWATGDEKRAFHFFQHVTAPCLAADHDGAFFRVLVLQICQTEPAVRHAVLAVSSLHEGMVQAAMMAPMLQNNDVENRSSFALYQYNRAIACLLEQMRTVNARPLVPLLTCVLFVCIELMQSKDKESLIHLEQGRQILSQLGPRVTGRSPEIDLIKQHLVPMYTRMSLTSLMLGCAPTAIPDPLKTLTEVPMVFKSIDEVRYALYDFMDQSLRFAKKSHAAKISKVPEEDMRAFELEQDVLLRKLAKFNVAFSLYRSTKAKEAPPGSIALIQVHVHTTFIWVSTALSRHETVFDDYVDTFSAIIPLASEFINTLFSPSNPSTKSPNNNNNNNNNGPDTRRLSAMFTFEMHVIAPLYFVAAKCRHPMIRRAALDLLRRNPGRRENLWRANVMATIAEHTMKLEEKHLRDAAVTAQQRNSRSVSPPEHHNMQDFPYSFGPGDAWGVGSGNLEGVPFPDNFFGSTHHSQPPQQQAAFGLFDPVPQVNNNNRPVSSSAGTSMSVDYPGISGQHHHMPIDPSLLFDTTTTAVTTAEVSSSVHSFSVAPSIASSLDDLGSAQTIFVGGAGSGKGGNNNTAVTGSQAAWGSNHNVVATPGIALKPPTPRGDDSPFGNNGMLSQSAGSPSVGSEGSPEIHAIDSFAGYGGMVGGGGYQIGGGYGGGGMEFVLAGGGGGGYGGGMNMGSGMQLLSLSQPALRRSGDAPYDVPERYRVRESILGPEKEDGSSWVMMFRKLGGLDGEWDVLTESVVC
ncbi:hypothetical protein QBC36DRAFT_312635 [Triangularia setosa]|uniref:Zn(2)-C6 fungal-type domain-containing protein n=1 Tax=Triangularia setosa TaxID=2587417 RepID=A0AAN6W741_9PEZI|nr:hypothetical protein QBC36DRAFT_312635 [Podospora setosa]